MKTTIKILSVFSIIILASCSSSDSSKSKKSDYDYKMDVSSSEVRLTTVKDEGVKVKGFLNFKSGELDFTKSPQLKLTIDMTTWNSGLKLRDDRVQNIFFDVASKVNQTAELIVYKIDQDKHIQKALADKQMYMGSVSAKLKFNGKTINVRPMLKIGFMPNGKLKASTTKPFEVKISELGLDENLKKLMLVCGHKNIEDVVEINVVTTFSK